MDRLVKVLAVIAVAGGFCGLAHATDRVVLKDGRTVEGTIIREASGAVWIKTSVGGLVAEQMFSPSEISRVEKGVAATEAPASTPGTSVPAGVGAGVANAAPSLTTAVPGAESEEKYPPGVPRALVLTLGDRENGHMVGVYMVSSALRDALPTMERELGTDKSGVAVLRIHSGGGYGYEVPRLSDFIHNELKPRFRTVGWISYAISAAAMTGHTLEEVYFTTQGSYGSCTGFYGSADRPVEGIELERALYEMEKISTRGQHNPLIMRSMQIQQPLSATISPEGDVRWYPDAKSGEIIVNHENEILSFNAKSAERVKFSSGTADTVEELGKLMGYKELHWVGRRVAGVPWPVSQSEAIQMKFREQTKLDEENFDRYYRNFAMYVQLATAQQEQSERGKFVGKARQALNQIKNMVDNNPNQAIWTWQGTEQYKEWLLEQEKLLRDLMR
jgi:hypothetical protein